MALNQPGRAQIILSADDQTLAAFASVSRRFSALQGEAVATKDRLAGIAAAVGSVLAALAVKDRIELLDQIDKLTEKTGLSVESLSVLRYQAALANVSFEELAKGVGRLSKNMTLAAGGNQEAAATFAAMGINVRDGNGALKSQDALLGEIADKFKGYEDGAAKSALAQRLFGKEGADMIPLLNKGSDGLARQAKEAKELGLLFGGDLTHNAAELNDNLARLKLTSEAAAISIGSKLVPALNQLITNYLELKKQGNLAGLFLTGGDQTDNPGAALDEVNTRLATMKKLRDELDPKKSAANKINDVVFGDVADLDRQIAVAEKQRAYLKLLQRDKALEGLGDVSDAISRRLGKKTEAPITKDPGGDRGEQILKKTLEARLKAIQDFAELQKVGIEFGNQLAEAAYAAGFLSVQELFDKQRQAREAGYANDTKALKDNITAQEALLAGTKNEDTRVKARGDIADARSKLQKLDVDFANKSAAAFEAERVATQRAKDAYDALGASVLDLEGKTLEAAKARIEKQARDDALVAAQAGQDQALAQRKGALLKLDAELAAVQKRYGLLVQQTADAETLIGLNATESGASERDTLIAVGAERQKALVQLRELAAAAAQLADEKGTPEAAAAARALGLALKRAAAEADPLLVKTREVGKEAGDALASAAEDAILHWQGFMSLLRAVEQQILQIILRSQVTKPLGDYLGNALGGNGQASGGGGFLGKLLPGLFGSSSVSDTAFGSTSFADALADGIIPLATGTNYVPQDMLALVHQGEAVVPKEYNHGGGGMTFAPTFNISGPVDKRTQDQLAMAAYQGAQRAMARNG